MRTGLSMALPATGVETPPALSSGRWLAVLAFGAVVLLCARAYLAFSLPVNSDEWQHLHVAWELTQGNVLYRDVFDNHAPFFQFLTAPIVAAIGERADIVPLMRLTMIPLYGIALLLTWYIGRSLWSARVGAIAAAIAAAAPIFFQVSVEFRPDELWMVLWLGVVAALASPLGTRRKGALAGILIGAAFAVSFKTILLIASAGVAAATLATIPGVRRERARGTAVVAGVLGAMLVPAVIAAGLASMGALRAAAYCLVTHNVDPHLGNWGRLHPLVLLLLVGWPACLFALRRFGAPRSANVRWRRRAFVLSSAVLYVLALYGGWPLVTHQDLLPALPILSLGAAAAAVTPGRTRTMRVSRALVVVLVASACLVNVATILLGERVKLQAEEARLARVLELSRPGDPVMDAKGFAIFRHRPVYWVLESITRQRMRDGTIADPIASELASTATPLVLADNLPDIDRAFVEENYVCVDDAIFVAGRRLASPKDGEPTRFTVKIPLSYALIGEDGLASGRIDGRDVGSGIHLAPGEHTLESATGSGLAIIWAPALQRGLAPVARAIRRPSDC
jgi:Dolichyl-phosphate-mannose-protein mannosyltransferase